MSAIKLWNEDDRPREKLLLKGVDALSDAELLAILINNGTTEQSAVDVCRALLQAVQGSLSTLSRLTVKEILQLKIKGIGPAKAVAIVAALALATRRELAEHKTTHITCSKDAAAYLKAKLQHKTNEVFAVLYMNQANFVLHYEELSIGGITGTVADPRIILKNALTNNATCIILCHNHPSGGLQPSRADKQLTEKVKQAALFMDITVADHIIVSERGYFSFADEGLL
ncbi:MAG: RadC family protein [Chitinophagaceae bacterium]